MSTTTTRTILSKKEKPTGKRADEPIQLQPAPLLGAPREALPPRIGEIDVFRGLEQRRAHLLHSWCRRAEISSAAHNGLGHVEDAMSARASDWVLRGDATRNGAHRSHDGPNRRTRLMPDGLGGSGDEHDFLKGEMQKNIRFRVNTAMKIFVT